MPRGQAGAGYPLKKKLAAVREYLATGLASTTASKHGVTPPSLKAWARQYEAGELKDPQGSQSGEEAAAPPAATQANGKRARRMFDDAFKARVVEDFLQRPPGTQFKTFCQERDLGEGQVRQWLEAHRSGRLVATPEPDRSERTRIVPRPVQTPSVLHAQLSLSVGEDAGPTPALTALPVHIQFYVASLEKQNKALRKMLQVAMEAM